jgi:hypothetical protein
VPVLPTTQEAETRGVWVWDSLEKVIETPLRYQIQKQKDWGYVSSTCLACKTVSHTKKESSCQGQIRYT